MRLGLGLAITGAQGAGGVNGLDLNFAGGRYALNSLYSSALPASFSFTRAAPDAYGLIDGEWTAFGTDEPVIIPGKGMQVYRSFENLLAQSDRLDDTRYWEHGAGATLIDGKWNGIAHLTHYNAVTAAGRVTWAIDFQPDTATIGRFDFYFTPSGGTFTRLGAAVVTFADGSTNVTLDGSAPGGLDPIAFAEPIEGGYRLHLTVTLASGGHASLAVVGADGSLTPRRAQINAGGPRPYQPTAPAATNYLTYSEDDAGAPGAFGDHAPTLDATAIEGGFPCMEAVYPSGTGTGASVFRGTLVALAAGTYSWGFDIKFSRSLGVGETLYVLLGGDADIAHLALTAAEVLNPTEFTRFEGPTGVLASGPASSQIYFYGNNIASPLTVWVKGRQIEGGPISTSPIPTNGSQQTRAALNPVRAADKPTIEGLMMGTSGTLVVDLIAPLTLAETQILFGSTDRPDAYLYLQDGVVRSYNHAESSILNTDVVLTAGQRARIGVTWEGGRRVVAANGTVIGSDAGGFSANPDLDIGSYNGGVFQPNTTIWLVTRETEAVSNERLAQMTELPE